MNQVADQRLAEAVQAGDEVAVGQALADGADPNTVGRFRGSVLATAARGGWLGIVGLLVDAGARIGPADPYTASPLRAAVLEAHAEVVQSLVAHGALGAEHASRSSVLTEAVSYTAFRPTPAALATLRVLLEAGAAPGPSEEPALITAVMRPVAPAVLRLLLTYGANANQRRSDGTPAIVVAARRGDHAAVDVLLQAGADVDARDGKGRTALMHAVERDEQRVITALLLAGAAIGAVSADGMTALQLARGWQRQNVQFMLGERHAGLDDVPIVRTVVRAVPTGVPRCFSCWRASSTSLWTTSATTSGRLGRARTPTRHGRLPRGCARRSPPAANASWHQLDVTADELAAVRSALGELAYGTTRVMPAGASRPEIIDVLEELNRQLGR